MKKVFTQFSLVVIICSITIISYSQSPGIIVRPAGGGTVTKLNPNGDSWSSTSASGYVSNDITESEIPFKIVPATFTEPTGDLNRGPSGGFSDIVKDVDGSGFYTYFDGTNLYFRLRIGGIVSGAKGYSVMIDADQKFGSSGSNPDPNYIANTSGSNGNPGFEWEVVLETTSRVAIYSVDGTNSPVYVTSFPLSTNQQVSIANSNASSDPDYFYDFYVPISAFTGNPNTITATTPLRMVATTVMAPQPAIGGPVSDIYGVNGYTDPSAAWMDIIKYETPFTPTNIQTATSTIGNVMTAAPVLTTPINSGTNVTINGTWTQLDATKSATAKIRLYKNGIKVDSTTATSGAGWSIPAINVVQNDILYVTAQGQNETTSPQSNIYKVPGCTTANTTTTTGLTFSCISDRGMQGARPSNASVKVYKITATGAPVVYADDANFTYKVTYGTTTSTDWRYDSVNTQSGSACTGGQADISLAQYAITATLPGYCESVPVFTGGCSLGATTAAPVITQTTLYEGNTIVSGTATAGTTVKLYKNNLLDTFIVLAAGVTTYSFTNRALYKNDLVEVRSQSTGQCESAGTQRTVVQMTSVPFINTSTSGTLIAGATTISGTSSEPAGTVVTVYESGTSKGTANVLSDGTWSLTYTVVLGKTYYATQQRTGASISNQTPTYNVQSATTAVPTIKGSYTETTSPVVISAPAGFGGKIFLYEDGQRIDSLSVTSSSSATDVNIPVNTTLTNKLYAGGILTATAQATGSAENTTSSNSVTVTCAIPAVPSISPVSTTIFNGNKVTYTITTAQANLLFTIRDSTDHNNLGTSAFGNGSNLDLTSVPFTSDGNISIRIKSTSFSGPGCESYAAASVRVITSSPSVTTTAASSILATSATVGGNVTASNGASVTERGIVYNTSGTPTTADTKLIIGSGTGVYSQSITGLTAQTTYYARAYAVNTVGTAYGNEINFTTATPAPSAPSIPTVSNKTNSGFTLTWPAVTGATSYKLDIATDAAFTSFVAGYNDSTINGTSHAVSGLTANTVYYFRIKAVNAGGASANSAAGTTVTLPSTNANLSGLSLSDGNLSPSFAAATTNYAASVGNNVTSLTVTPMLADQTATVTVNGTAITGGSASNPINLNVGANTITVVATAQDGTTVKTYTITVTRAAASSNADLSGLTISQGTLSPAFAAGTTNYAASVGNNVTSLTVTPMLADQTATVTVNGTAITGGSASDPININVGANTITVVATAQDGTTTKTYTITVTRAAASSNADLSGLTISQGTLSPTFAAGTTNYAASVGNNVTALTVTPSLADPTSTVTVNGTAITGGSASDPINLSVGANTITAVVTAQDGTTSKTYLITATRQISTPSAPNMTRSSDLGISNTDNVTSNNTPEFVGTADPNATITLYADNVQIGQNVADASGNWSITSTALFNGSHLVQAKASLNGAESVFSNSLSVTIDKEAPVVSSISRLNPDSATTSAQTVTYRLAFSEPVSGVVTDNFAITTLGTVTATIASVSSNAGTIIDVTVSNISGEGQLRLDLNQTAGITDEAGNPIAGSYTTGEEYTITTAGALPVTLTDFKAFSEANAVKVSWKAVGEINVKKYEIEKSSTGLNFTKAGEVSAKGNSSTDIIYTWTDIHPASGNNFYRLKSIDKDGTTKYSDIKAVNFSSIIQYLKVTPNPVTNKTLNLKIGNLAAGKYVLILYNNNGKEVFTGSIMHDGGSATKRIQLPPLLSKGVYNLNLSSQSLQINEMIIIE